MRRRAVLAAVSSVLTAGCAGLVGEADRRQETLSPAPVPAERPRAANVATPRVPRCPDVPADVAARICSDRSGTGLRLTPEASTYESGPDPFGVTLVNGGDVTFRTGRDWWTLARVADDGWERVASGDRTDRLSVGPGESFVWELNATGEGGAGVARPDVAFGGGRYALVVTGYVAGLNLAAVAAPFRVEPALG